MDYMWQTFYRQWVEPMYYKATAWWNPPGDEYVHRFCTHCQSGIYVRQSENIEGPIVCSVSCLQSLRHQHQRQEREYASLQNER